MAKFMDVHSGFFGVSAEQLAEAHGRDLAIEADEGVHFEHAWLDPDAGKVFCLATRAVPRVGAADPRAGGSPDARDLRTPDRGMTMTTQDLAARDRVVLRDPARRPGRVGAPQPTTMTAAVGTSRGAIRRHGPLPRSRARPAGRLRASRTHRRRSTSASRRSTGPARWASTTSTATLLDTTVDPAKPEVLVYAPDRHGRLHLVALEYVVFQAPWIAEHGSAMPMLFGQMFMATGDHNRFDIPAFFSLHVWLYRHNPSGLFAPFNPRVSCDPGRDHHRGDGAGRDDAQAAVSRFDCAIDRASSVGATRST